MPAFDHLRLKDVLHLSATDKSRIAVETAVCDEYTKDHMALKDIAARHGVSTHPVGDALARHGVIARPPRGQNAGCRHPDKLVDVPTATAIRKHKRGCPIHDKAVTRLRKEYESMFPRPGISRLGRRHGLSYGATRRALIAAGTQIASRGGSVKREPEPKRS